MVNYVGINTVKRFNLFCLTFLFLIATFGYANNSNTLLTSKKNPVLLKVFSNEISVSNKIVLKLYDDNTYEYLHFQLKHSKPIAKSESGDYKFKGQKLLLSRKNKKNEATHPNKYCYVENIGLFEKKQKKNSNDLKPELTINNEEKYNQLFYKDTVFGIVSNDKKIANKLNDVRYLPKPEPAIIPVIVEELVRFDSIDNTILPENEDAIRVKLSKFTLQKIKAVIVVGMDDDGNKDYIAEQKILAKFLRNLGVRVTEYYYPNCKWEDVKKGSKDANIFVYNGHGITLGEDMEGTLYLNEGIIYGPDITEGLKLHKNALVLFNHACSSAGSSAADRNDIGIVEATKRVEDYAKPFLKLNAGCYYANNYIGSLKPFLISFFNGIPVKTIYKKEASKYSKIELTKLHKLNKNYELSLSSDKPAPNETHTIITTFGNGKEKIETLKSFKSYEVAYVGKPNYTVNDLFK